MEERILVYKNLGNYNKLVRYYDFWCKALQNLLNGLSELKITPNMENIKKLMDGEVLISLMEDCNVSKHLSFLPERMLNSIQNTINDDLEYEYNEKVGKLAQKLIYDNENSNMGVLNLDYFTIVNGMIKITKECAEHIDGECCTYVDTENKKTVYNAYLKFMEAYNEFEKAVKESAKKPNPLAGTIHEWKTDFSRMRAVGGEGSYAIVKVIDGELKFKGERFDELL